MLPVSATINESLSLPAFSRVIGTVERPISIRMAGMGMAGISSAKGFDALNYNPAGLADSGFTLTIPYVTATVYNPGSMISTNFLRNTIDFAQGGMNADEYIESAEGFASALGTYNKVYGTIGTFAILMVWLYYSSIILLIGGQVNNQTLRKLIILDKKKQKNEKTPC